MRQALSPRIERWLKIRQPAGIGEVIRHHLVWALVIGAVLLAARFYPFREGEFQTCMFRRLTGYPCATCGFTRTFVALAHGRWEDGVRQSPLAAGVFVALCALFVWHGAGVLSRRRISPGSALIPGPWTRVWLWIVLALAVMANWGYRLALGLK